MNTVLLNLSTLSASEIKLSIAVVLGFFLVGWLFYYGLREAYRNYNRDD